MRTLARDRRTLRVCACGWGSPSRLQDFVQGLCKIFSRNSRLPRQNSSPNPCQNHSKIDQNGSKTGLETPRVRVGSEAEKNIENKWKKGGRVSVKPVPFGTPKSRKKRKNAKRGRSRISPARPLQDVFRNFALFLQGGLPGPIFWRPGVPRGALLVSRGG